MTNSDLRTPADVIATIMDDEGWPSSDSAESFEAARRALERRGFPTQVSDMETTPNHKMSRLLEELSTGVGISEEQRALLTDKKRILAVVKPTEERRANILRVENGGSLIILDYGLLRYVYSIARAISLRIGFHDGIGPRTVTPELKESGKRADQLIGELLEGLVSTRVLRTQDFPIDNRNLLFASDLTTAAERFLIAHEAAHQLLGHLGGEGLFSAAGLPLPDRLSPDSKHELEADAMGLSLCWNASGGDFLRGSLAWAGAEFLLRTFDLGHRAGVIDLKSDPGYGVRLDYLRAQTSQLTPPRVREGMEWLLVGMEGVFDAVNDAHAWSS